MRLLFSFAPLFAAALLSTTACQRQVAVTTPTDDTAGPVSGPSTPAPVANPTTEATPEPAMVRFDTTARPAWLQKKISALQADKPQNPRARILSYTLEGQTVYYQSAPCCDQFTTLYDAKGKVICQPDGGITGRGDGKCPDFEKNRTNEKLVWEDAR
ncbi:DUF6970 domain-containing protein [Hymenobacter sp. DG25A]|uniref:DUF6970 domain-containing protein n=1 Tax=Hymenobacter sp. DG25A TaxID=1385663 RepID=UPI000A7EAED7|nr:hypothetical protein [Hymenobacter sp. DG25A]